MNRKAPPLTPDQARRRGIAARDRYGFSFTTQEPEPRVVAAGLEDVWWEGYRWRCANLGAVVL